jgi:hypothetical protein
MGYGAPKRSVHSNNEIDSVISTAVEGSPLHKNYGVYLQVVGVATVPLVALNQDVEIVVKPEAAFMSRIMCSSFRSVQVYTVFMGSLCSMGRVMFTVVISERSACEGVTLGC